MRRGEIDGFPALPPGIAEWEDLLVRVEIMPRALRATLEDSEPGDARAGAILGELLERETRVGRWLEAAAAMPVGEAGPPPAGDLRSLAERFSAVRIRNFAMLQRRGVEVWAWTGVTDDGAPATVYQLLHWLVRADAAALAELRAVGAC